MIDDNLLLPGFIILIALMVVIALFLGASQNRQCIDYGFEYYNSATGECDLYDE